MMALDLLERQCRESLQSRAWHCTVWHDHNPHAFTFVEHAACTTTHRTRRCYKHGHARRVEW